MSQDRYRCPKCNRVIATKRRGVMHPRSPAQALRIEPTRIQVLCPCGGKRWIALRAS